MAGTLVPVRFKLAWQNYRVGDVITPSAMLRDWLLANGYVEIADVDLRDGRPAKAVGRAARKLAQAGRELFAGEKQ